MNRLHFAIVFSTFFLSACGSNMTYTLRGKEFKENSALEIQNKSMEAYWQERKVENPPTKYAVPDKPTKAIKVVMPVYPKEILPLRGEVHFFFAIDEHGKVGKITIVKSTHPLFSEAIRTAYDKWEFEPNTINGKPSALGYEQRYTFSPPN